MTRYADPTRCPDCLAALPAAPASCPTCDLPLRGPAATALLETLRVADVRLSELRASADLRLPERTEGVRAPAAEADRGTGAGPDGGEGHDAGRRRSGISGSSVPRILLGLGALCLLVAAVTFLAVAWSWLGVGGRTGVLLALTIACGAGGLSLARRGLRVGAESFTAVALGLLALDVVGAESAGWLGAVPVEGLGVVVGTALLLAGLGLAAGSRTSGSAALRMPQLVAAAGLGLAVVAGLVLAPWTFEAWSVVAIGAGLGCAVLARRLHLRLLDGLACGGAVLWWAALVLSGLGSGLDGVSLREWWGGAAALGLLQATGWALLGLAPRLPHRVRASALAAAATLVTAVVLVPVLDEQADRAVPACLAAVMGWTVLVVVAAPRWRPALAAPQLLAALPTTPVAAEVVVQAVLDVLALGPTATQPVGVLLPGTTTSMSPLLLVPVVLVLGLAGLVHRRAERRGGSVLGLSGSVLLAALVTLAALPLPLATVVLACGAAGAAAVLGGLRGSSRVDVLGTAVGGTLLLVTVVTALPSEVLSAAALALVVVVAEVTGRRAAVPVVVPVAAAVLPAALGALVWTGGGILDVGPAWRALPALLGVGALALARPRPATELAAAATGLLAAVVALVVLAASGATTSTPLAVHLTVAGALLGAASLLHAHRRPVGLFGALLLAAATWVRLADLGVSAPEAYTLPSALALLALGLLRLRRDPRVSTRAALLPGLVLALVPTLLWVLGADRFGLRAVLLGATCLVLVLAGAHRRWSAPVLVGAAVGMVLVLAELAPYAARTPSWVLIAAAGLVLSTVGVTWEARTRDLRHASRYLARLR